MKLPTATTSLATNHYFEKEMILQIKNTRKPPHQLDFQFSYTKINELEGVIEKEKYTTLEDNMKHSHLLTTHAPLT